MDTAEFSSINYPCCQPAQLAGRTVYTLNSEGLIALQVRCHWLLLTHPLRSIHPVDGSNPGSASAAARLVCPALACLLPCLVATPASLYASWGVQCGLKVWHALHRVQDQTWSITAGRALAESFTPTPGVSDDIKHQLCG